MTLRRALKRLRLKPGDVIICRDWHLMDQLEDLRIPGLDFSIPILYAPDKNSISRMPREELLKQINA